MSAVQERARGLAREPLLHFVVLGAALFALHARVAPPPAERIEVAPAFVAGLRAEQAERTGQPPSDDELRGLVERHVDEEVLYREAIALGLDRGDVIVRRRLVQKMELLARAAIREPTDAELGEHLTAQAERYRGAETVSFEHVFVSRDRYGAAAAAKAGELLRALRAGADPKVVGDPFVAGASFARRTRGDLDAGFGGVFAEAMFAAPIAQWSGPVASSYGLHLVRIGAHEAGRAPDLAAVRARVREDFLSERREGAVRAEIQRLRGRYHVDMGGL